MLTSKALSALIDYHTSIVCFRMQKKKEKKKYIVSSAYAQHSASSIKLNSNDIK